MRLHFRRRLADQGSPKAKCLARALSLIRAKRIVVESLLCKRVSVASETE
jgi:hypothetical protein